jgi:hypothetical protein
LERCSRAPRRSARPPSGRRWSPSSRRSTARCMPTSSPFRR